MSHDDKKLTRAEVIERAAEMDKRRQQQIRRQSKVIDRLLTENQILSGLVAEIASHEGNLIGLRGKAKEVLASIERLQEQARKDNDKEKKND